MSMMSTDVPGPARLMAQKEREYRFMFQASYPLFLAAAVVLRFVPSERRPLKRRGLNVFGDARELANTVIPFAFMR